MNDWRMQSVSGITSSAEEFIILIERYIRYERPPVLFLGVASRIGVVPVEVNLCFAHDWPFEFISV